ncbi:MAG: glucoamylase family protein, partial [Sphaerochaeta sp.]|nr:glucoamylase family protein [Sphaerochaeta sp.]
GAHIASTLRSLSQQLFSVILTVACLPHDAYFSLHAILRTCWRMVFSHRHLLQWRPSESNSQDAYQTLASSIRFMWIAPTLALSLTSILLLLAPTTLLVASPMLLLWLCSPAIVWKISRPIARQEEVLTEDQNRYLRRLARKTWSFFETFMTAQDNWLPPDNFQELPVAKIAHRTSPTNIGLALLANLGARDMGYISDSLLLERTNLTIQSLESLETYKKHFYNWYDTVTLQPLAPRYVSTVDSGNLVAHLLTLHAGLLSLADEKIPQNRIWHGLEDTTMNLADLLGKEPPATFLTFRDALDAVLKASPSTVYEVWKDLERLVATAKELHAALAAREDPVVNWWVDMLMQQCHDSLDEYALLMPWLPQAPLFENEPGFQQVCGFSSLRELFELESDMIGTHGERTPQFVELLSVGHAHAQERFSMINRIALQVENFTHMDFSFLYNKKRNLFTVGFTVDRRRKDSGHYDLLASEARLTSFIAIAQEEVPKENWFSLGRLIAKSGTETLLFSWSGSMFEYLMPLIVMPSYKETLLGQTCEAAVRRQIEYGDLLDIPWGISESGYNAFDVSINYQYRAFGVPGLGLRREVLNDLVVAPYATALSVMVAPQKACLNLQRLSHGGFEGAYG